MTILPISKYSYFFVLFFYLCSIFFKSFHGAISPSLMVLLTPHVRCSTPISILRYPTLLFISYGATATSILDGVLFLSLDSRKTRLCQPCLSYDISGMPGMDWTTWHMWFYHRMFSKAFLFFMLAWKARWSEIELVSIKLSSTANAATLDWDLIMSACDTTVRLARAFPCNLKVLQIPQRLTL